MPFLESLDNANKSLLSVAHGIYINNLDALSNEPSIAAQAVNVESTGNSVIGLIEHESDTVASIVNNGISTVGGVINNGINTVGGAVKGAEFTLAIPLVLVGVGLLFLLKNSNSNTISNVAQSASRAPLIL